MLDIFEMRQYLLYYIINALKDIVAVMALTSYLCRNSDAVLGRIAFV